MTIEIESLYNNTDLSTVRIKTENGTIENQFTGNKVIVPIENAKLWTPETPYLYDFEIETPYDRIESYFALRTLSIKTINNIPRLCLNDNPYYFHGILDQGYFSDGLYLPMSPKGYKEDIKRMKELGFNTLRKHIKVEPAIYYYLCDTLGMVVFQDMVNNGQYSFFKDTILPTIDIKHYQIGSILEQRRLKIILLLLQKKRLNISIISHVFVTGQYLMKDGDNLIVMKCMISLRNLILHVLLIVLLAGFGKRK